MFCLLCPEPVTMDKVHYCERFIELMIDLEVRNLQWLSCYIIIMVDKFEHMTVKYMKYFFIP